MTTPDPRSESELLAALLALHRAAHGCDEVTVCGRRAGGVVRFARLGAGDAAAQVVEPPVTASSSPRPAAS